MLKTGSDSGSFKLIKKNRKTLFQLNSTLFLTLEAKKSFQNLKKAFCKEPICNIVMCLSQ